ncbi:MAG: AraC family transcriptional regulator [Bacilli bacterium]|nr:AraC family transcriptional regulator [Bacilli bacterium]
MEWLDSVRRSIDFIEKHLEDDITISDVAKHVSISLYFLERGFSVMTGYSIGEYLRNRRLYQAALDLQKSKEKIIDIAYKYCYDTPESFTKAFSRFHGTTPKEVREGAKINVFLPLIININISGGKQMDYKIAPMFPIKLIGFQKIFDTETSYKKIPKFWDEICEKYANNVYLGKEPTNPYEKAIIDNCIGEYAICIDDLEDGKFRYLIAGRYAGGEVPEGMIVYEFPRMTWAIFDCIGPNPQTLQSVNTRIFKEWLPGNPDYEIDGNATVEWYDCINGEMTAPDYHSAIWIPVKEKR